MGRDAILGVWTWVGSGNIILGGSPEGAILGDGDAPSALQPFVKFF